MILNLRSSSGPSVVKELSPSQTIRSNPITVLDGLITERVADCPSTIEATKVSAETETVLTQKGAEENAV